MSEKLGSSYVAMRKRDKLRDLLDKDPVPPQTTIWSCIVL